MLEFFGILFLIGLVVLFFPLILAGLGVAFCLLMALLCWLKETFIK